MWTLAFHSLHFCEKKKTLTFNWCKNKHFHLSDVDLERCKNTCWLNNLSSCVPFYFRTMTSHRFNFKNVVYIIKKSNSRSEFFTLPPLLSDMWQIERDKRLTLLTWLGNLCCERNQCHPQIVWSHFVWHSRGSLGFRNTQCLSQWCWKRHGMENGWIHPLLVSVPWRLHLTTLCCWKKNNIFFSLYEAVYPVLSLAEDLASCLWSLWHLIAAENNYHQIDWNLCILLLYGLTIDFNLRTEWTREWFLAHASFVPYCADWNYDGGQWLWRIWNFKNQLSDKKLHTGQKSVSKNGLPLAHH